MDEVCDTEIMLLSGRLGGRSCVRPSDTVLQFYANEYVSEARGVEEGGDGGGGGGCS